MSKSYLFFVCLFFMASTNLFAVPAYPYPIEVTQPDGTTLTITLKGDEFASWAESSDGYTLLRNSDGFFEYAQKDARGELVLSGVIAQDVQLRTLKDNALLLKTPKKLGFSTSQIQVFHQLREMQQQALNDLMQMRSSQSDATPKAAPISGTVRLPFILVQFPGKAFTKTKADFQMLCNQVGYSVAPATGSLHDYFAATSYNKLDFQVDVFGPYTLANTIDYYDYNTTGSQTKTIAIITEATTLAQGGGCNFANYDANNDGKVDGVHVIFAGYDQSAGAPKGDAIWATAWSTTGTFCTRNGKGISQFSMSSELRGQTGTTISPIGVIAHELSHVFGLPDLYDTDYGDSGGASVDIAQWCVMASGTWNNNGDTPPHHMAWCKDQLGWVPITSLTDPAYVTIPNPAVQGASYKITTNTANEYFLLENRQKQGWDQYIPSSGMLIYHVDQNYINSNKQTINANPAHRGLYVKQAGGDATSTSSNRTADPYPQGSKNSFTDTSVPNSKSWAGVNTVKPVTDITHNTSAKTVSFVFRGDAPAPVTNFQATVTDGNKVVLTWTPSITTTVTAYKIYRDNILQYTISGQASNTYTQINVPNGTYQYSISAFNGLMESAKVNSTAVVTQSTNTSCAPVYNLNADASVNDEVRLTWDASNATSSWQSFYTIVGGQYGATTFTSTSISNSIIVGRKWTTSDLGGMNGFSIEKVKFASYDYSTYLANYTAVVYSVSGGAAPVLVREQAFTSVPTGGLYLNNEVTFTSPVVIDASKEWIIGIRYDVRSGGTGVAVVRDQMGNNDSKTVCYTTPYGWEAWSNWGTNATHNPCMDVYFKGENPSKFVVYRNGEFLANTTNRTYTDATVDAPTVYSYCVAAGYSSCTSEPVCMEAKSKGHGAVKNLQISQTESGDIKLVWTAPLASSASQLFLKATSAEPELVSYSIRRDNVLLDVINKSFSTYTDSSKPESGSYVYCVKADYDTGSSSKAVCESILYANPVGIEEILHNNASVYSKNQMIYAVSKATDPIRRIEIYNTQGKLIYLKDKVNDSAYTINNVSLPEICIVRLITEAKVLNVKIIK